VKHRVAGFPPAKADLSKHRTLILDGCLSKFGAIRSPCEECTLFNSTAMLPAKNYPCSNQVKFVGPETRMTNVTPWRMRDFRVQEVLKRPGYFSFHSAASHAGAMCFQGQTPATFQLRLERSVAMELWCS
jgi:hypothetical protein